LGGVGAEFGYEVELRAVRHREHELTMQNDIGRIAKHITIWMAACDGAKPAADF
jgi:hypothetical protein